MFCICVHDKNGVVRAFLSGILPTASTFNDCLRWRRWARASSMIWVGCIMRMVDLQCWRGKVHWHNKPLPCPRKEGLQAMAEQV
eukprot:2483876-Amphidinium_carterae.1